MRLYFLGYDTETKGAQNFIISPTKYKSQMKKAKLQKLLAEGYKAKVYLQDGKLKAYLYKEGTNEVHPVYYNHVKSILNEYQKDFINAYNRVKNYAFRDDVEMNVKYQAHKETTKEIQLRVVRTAIRKKEYLEQL